MLKSIWGVSAAGGIAIVGALLLLSGGSLLDSANDALLPFNDQSASTGDRQANTGSLTTEAVDIPPVDSAIRANSHIGAVVGDIQFTVDGHRQVYVEGELWGVSAILKLEETTSLDGPWITVDTGALMQTAMSDLDIEQFSDLGVGRVDELSHEEIDDVLSDLEFTSADYTVNSAEYEVDTASIYVTIQPTSGSILALVPFEPPPNLWSGPVPKVGSGHGSIGNVGSAN